MIKQTIDHRLRFAAATVVYSLLLGIFYWKYVPLVAGYQMILAPILVFLTIWTAVDIRKGLLAFIFLFPLINNLPYFFKLYEPLPMAPSALILFLFFFLGWLLHRTFAVPDPARDGDKIDEPIFTPLKLFAGLVFVSALITFWRYTNFFPLWRPRIYELVTNAYGTSAGGAIMSVVFYSLTYLTGIAFFMILVRTVRTEGFVRKAIMVLGASTLISLGFGLIQHFVSVTLGNNPSSINPYIVENSMLNATFKDALSFGTFLSIIIPFNIAIVFSSQNKTLRFLLGIIVLPSTFLLFFAGSKIALFSLFAALIVFILFRLFEIIIKRKTSKKKIIWLISSAFLLLTIFTVTAVFSKLPPLNAIRNSILIKRLEDVPQSFKYRFKVPWDIAAQMVQDYPISGIGMGSFIIESSNYAKAHKKDLGTPESVENLPLQIGSELGIPGVLIFFWILWEIIRKGVKSYRHSPGASLERSLVPAAGIGLLAFFLNAQLHSYIGSYEIHYIFWFFAGLLFTSKASHPYGNIPIRKHPYLKFSALALIALGVISLSWSSTQALSLRARTRQFGLRQEFGFGPIEKDAADHEFRWSSRLAGTTCEMSEANVQMFILASHPDIQTRPVRVKIFITPNLAIKPIKLLDLQLKECRWEKIVLPIPADIRGSALLLFEVDRTWNPLKNKISADSRDLGIAVANIKTSG